MNKSRIKTLQDMNYEDIRRMDTPELKQAFRDVQRKANARFDIMSKSKNYRWRKFSRPYKTFEGNGGKLSFPGQQAFANESEMRRYLYDEIRRGLDYINRQTSSVSGVKLWRENAINSQIFAFDNVFGRDIRNQTELKKFYGENKPSPLDPKWTLGDERLSVTYKIMDEIRDKQQGALIHISSDTLIVVAYTWVSGGQNNMTVDEYTWFIDRIIDELNDPMGEIEPTESVGQNMTTYNKSAIEFARKLRDQRKPPDPDPTAVAWDGGDFYEQFFGSFDFEY